MKQVFKQLILEFQEEEVPFPSPREFTPLEIPHGLRKAFVLVGMRRSGKTWTLYQQIHHLEQRGVNRQQILYLNFEDDRLIGVTVHDMQALLEAYFELFPDMVGNPSLYFFFDEVHEVDGWEKFIRRLLDREKMEVYLTGSSAKLLSKEIASTLRGRTIVQEVFPYSFKEYLSYLKVEADPPFSPKKSAVLTHHLLEYLKWGGFPESVGLESGVHRKVLQSYIDVVIHRDIIERHKVSNPPVLRKLLTHCLQNPASLLSIHKMYQTMKSLGYATSKNSLYSYMGYFEDAYCLFSIPVFNLSGKKASLIPQKVYPIDTGLITAYSIAPELQKGPMFETLVFISLLRETDQISYYSTQNGLKVDFFTIFPDQSKALVQACLSLADEKTKKREITALKKAMEETGLKKGFLITLDGENEFNVDEGKIYQIPLINFVLGVSSSLNTS